MITNDAKKAIELKTQKHFDSFGQPNLYDNSSRVKLSFENNCATLLLPEFLYERNGKKSVLTKISGVYMSRVKRHIDRDYEKDYGNIFKLIYRAHVTDAHVRFFEVRRETSTTGDGAVKKANISIWYSLIVTLEIKDEFLYEGV